MNRKSTRRDFVTRGGALIGAGIATSAAAAASRSPARADSRDRPADREAIRALQATFVAAVERGAWGEAAALFGEQGAIDVGVVSATGRRAIGEVLASQPAGEAAFHAAYRIDVARGGDVIAFREGRAVASLPVDVKIQVPLKDDCTAASMARLQGHCATVHWESGWLEMECARDDDGWTLASLRYRASG